jgi:hypothetical protein
MANKVVLHIYDVSTNPEVAKLNKVLSAVGTGAFHGGVEVYGTEYSYGFIESGSGVFSNAPKGCTMHSYREAVDMGETDLSKDDVAKLIAKLKEEWPGSDYDLLRKNCVSFSTELVKQLHAGPVPSWVCNLSAAGATIQNGAMQASDAAGRAAIVAAAKANEFDKQYGISTTAHAKVTDMLRMAREMDEKHDLTQKGQQAVDQGKVMAGQAAEKAKAATGQLVFQLNAMNEKYKISDKVQQKMGEAGQKMKELDQQYKVSETVQQKKAQVSEQVGQQTNKDGGCFCQ